MMRFIVWPSSHRATYTFHLNHFQVAYQFEKRFVRHLIQSRFFAFFSNFCCSSLFASIRFCPYLLLLIFNSELFQFSLIHIAQALEIPCENGHFV